MHGCNALVFINEVARRLARLVPRSDYACGYNLSASIQLPVLT